MKYEDIYWEESKKIHLGKLIDFIDTLREEGESLIDAIMKKDFEDYAIDYPDLVWIVEGLLVKVRALALARLIFSITSEDAKDPKSVFLLEKRLHTFDKKVLLIEIKLDSERIRNMEFEDYRVQHFHLKICDVMKSLYEDFEREYNAEEK